jgi:AsmA-like C-terminal region
MWHRRIRLYDRRDKYFENFAANCQEHSFNGAGGSMKRRRVILVLGALAAVIIVILVSGALLLPRLIDSQLVKEKIGSLLAEKTKGTVSLAKIELVWFPRPTVLIGKAQFLFDDETQGTIQSVKIYPSIFYLLTGRVVVRRAQLQEPRVKIRLPADSEQLPGIEELEKAIRAALTYFTTELPGLGIDLSDGYAEIEIGDDPPVTLENVDARAVVSAKDMGFQLSARSNLCNRFQVEGKIARENLAAQLEVSVQQLKLKESLHALPFQLSEYAQQGEASFDLKIAFQGLRKIQAAIDGSTGALVLARRGGIVKVEAKKLKGSVVYDDGAIEAGIEQLDLVSPRLRASAALKSTPSFSSARVQIRDVDIVEIREAALGVADDMEGIKTLFRFVQAGTIPEMVLESSGPSLAEIGMFKNFIVSGILRNGRVIVSEPKLDLTNVTGSARISGGILEANELAANLGAMTGRDGKLRLGLEGKAAPFHLDMAVKSGAAELQAVLLKFVDHEPLRGELLKLRDVEGELAGRLILGEKLDAIAPVVAVSEMAIRANYERVPFPIVIKGGRFNYGQNAIRLEDVQGTVGRSTWAALSGTLHNDTSRRMKIDSGRMVLDLEQIKILLQSIKEVPSELLKVQSARGQIELEHLTLTGAYDDPAGWKFNGSGTVRQVAISHAQLPGPVALARGKFTAAEEKITLSDAQVEMLDATLLVGGVFQSRKGDRVNLEASGEGVVGEQMTRWLGRQIELPEELSLRSPWKIAAERLAWQAPDDFSFRGRASLAGGPRISIDAERQLRRIAVRELTVEDGARRAQMTLQLAEDNLALSFKGELGRQTFDKIFASFPAQDVSLQGDIRVTASLQQPGRFTADGKLEGSNVLLPLGREQVVIEKFDLVSGEGNMFIRSADLRWRNSRLTVAGKVAAAKEAVRVDLDVSGDRLDWGELNRSFGRAAAQKKDPTDAVPSLPPVEGTIRLKVDSFAFERFNLSALRLTADSTPSGITAQIEQAVACGINATGRIDVAGEEIGLDVVLAVTEAQLEPTTVCLLDIRHDVKGTYSLKGRIAGRGKREKFESSLKGNFEFSARDGEFVRAPGMDATFDYLNATGDFKVAFPDLDKESFPYHLVSVKGRVDGEVIMADEVIVHSPLVNLSGQGKVDLAQQRIDGKALIAVLRPVDEVISRIPLVGSIFGGSLLGIPVRVNGSLERPDVTYLAPADVGAELLNIPVRILGIPLSALRLFTPAGETPGNNSTQ